MRKLVWFCGVCKKIEPVAVEDGENTQQLGDAEPCEACARGGSARALSTRPVKLTKTQERAIIRMGAMGQINPYDFGASTISKFKNEHLIERIQVSLGGSTATRYVLTERGRMVAQMASAS
jgi:hypothetical protein